MKTKIISFAIAGLLLFNLGVKADEGMWLTLLLKQNYAEMQRLGLKLTPEQLYDINHASLKDAIVALDEGSCTGEIISAEGLMLTNHHCGYGEIQSHSTLEHDYLTDGFWAYSKDKELANPGKTASFLVRIESVTDKVLAGITDAMSESDRDDKIEAAIAKIKKEAIKGTHYDCKVKSMFDGNEYYLFVYETFKDIRLVGAPPSSIGKFGGDTDNWMWPRHTGDFSIFRVYTAPDGKPAEYSPNNVPLKSKYFLPISLNGIKKNDYAMIWGYPGSTDRYLSSYGVKLALDQVNPAIVSIRDVKLELMKKDMDANPTVRIQYASKYASIANYWKYFQGQSRGLQRLDVYGQKKALEDKFQVWVNADAERKAKYGTAIQYIADAYKEIQDKKYEMTFWYFQESLTGAEILYLAYQLQGMLKADLNEESKKGIKEITDAFYKDYNMPTDKKQFAAIFEMYYKNVPAESHPDFFKEIEKKYKGDFTKYAEMLYSKSILATRESFEKYLNKPNPKLIEKDPAFVAMNSVIRSYMELNTSKAPLDIKLEKGKRLFVDGLRKMQADKLFAPDANSTMRCTYGSVLDYSPADAIYYDYQTFLSGAMEKEDPKNEEFIIPAKLKELYKNKDYGQYGMGEKMPLCFLTNNDITGGNSGSPVINGNGELIGAAFDGNWEAMSGDIAFEPALQRTIVCDIRYILFIVDKYAGAKNLIQEMKIIKD